MLCLNKAGTQCRRLFIDMQCDSLVNGLYGINSGRSMYILNDMVAGTPTVVRLRARMVGPASF